MNSSANFRDRVQNSAAGLPQIGKKAKKVWNSPEKFQATVITGIGYLFSCLAKTRLGKNKHFKLCHKSIRDSEKIIRSLADADAVHDDKFHEKVREATLATVAIRVLFTYAKADYLEALVLSML